jgi:steroid delta-isomerase-like uncharacterized protein
LLAALS